MVEFYSLSMSCVRASPILGATRPVVVYQVPSRAARAAAEGYQDSSRLVLEEGAAWLVENSHSYTVTRGKPFLK